MRARSRVATWLSYPDVKAARVALAAGSLAGLAVLGACSEGTVATKVAGPKVSPPVSEPSFVGVVGANSHTVQVCVDNASPAGTYNFAVSHNNVQSIMLELPSSSDPVPVGYTANSTGPFIPGDMIDASVSITLPVGALVPECQEVFIRDDTPTHENNRMWNFGAGLGIVNPHGTVDIDLGAIPAGYTYSVVCVNDDPNLPQTPACAPAGPWSSIITYQIGQAVTHNGSTWRALTSNTNVAPTAGTDWETVDLPLVADPIYSSANVFHGSVVTYTFVAGTANPPLFLIIDEDGIDNGLRPNFFSAKDVNDQIAKLGQRKELRWFDLHPGDEIVLWTGQMGDEGWFAPKFIPQSWEDTGPTDDGLRNFLGLPVGPGLGAGPGDKEKYLDKIPDVTPLRAEGLEMLEGRLICAVVYDSDISINYSPLNGSLKGATLGIVAFTVKLDGVNQLFGQSSSTLPAVTLIVEDADEVCAGDQELFLDAPVPLTSSTEFDVVPGGSG